LKTFEKVLLPQSDYGTKPFELPLLHST